MRLFIFGLSLFLLSITAFCNENSLSQDSLTIALCDNEEQIVSRRVNEWRIAYYMGETELNMKTIGGFLSLNDASKPVYNRYRFSKIAAWTMGIVGIGCFFADGQVKSIDSPILRVGGAALCIGGIVIGYRNNRNFGLAIHAYNRDICKIK